MRAEPRQQLLQRERLDHVVVGAGIEPRHAVAEAVAGGQHQDRHAVAVRAQAAAYGQPIEIRHGDIEDDRVRSAYAHLRQRRLAVRRRRHVEPLAAQRPAERFGDPGVVVDDEDVHALKHSSASGASMVVHTGRCCVHNPTLRRNLSATP